MNSSHGSEKFHNVGGQIAKMSLSNFVSNFNRIYGPFKQWYSNINPANMTGAIDVIVVQQQVKIRRILTSWDCIQNISFSSQLTHGQNKLSKNVKYTS